MQEARVPSLGQEDPLEKEMANHSSILAWKISWTEEPGGLQFMGLSGGTVAKNLPVSAEDERDTGSIPWLGRSPGEGNGNPLQYSWLKNPRDGGTWWAAIYGIAQSQTQLTGLSSSSST